MFQLIYISDTRKKEWGMTVGEFFLKESDINSQNTARFAQIFTSRRSH